MTERMNIESFCVPDLSRKGRTNRAFNRVQCRVGPVMFRTVSAPMPGQGPRHGRGGAAVVNPGHEALGAADEAQLADMRMQPDGGEEEDMDLVAGLGEILEEEFSEIVECVGHAYEQAELIVNGSGSADPNVLDVGLATGPRPESVAMLAQEGAGIGEVIDDGIELAAAPSAEAAGSSAEASADADVVAAHEVPKPPEELMTDPSPMGYVYEEGRSVMRVQRGKPARSVTITCYRHSKCTMLLTEARCPSDLELNRWSLAVPAAPQGCSVEESRVLAAQHMALGKGQWAGRRRQQ